ncbi:MAG: HNH endonuclease [Ktedonobacteraceae bacterium]|nr:HNH endonuclease [Ktedonobacteraceae bacterium]MBO0789634.1 HNH endonuclease [Ktedonobacteraceae bacterium]
MSKVFVVDTKKQPLNPVHPGRARLLLTSGKAAVFRRFPFTIILKTVIEQPTVAPLRVKIDPGSRVTGLAIINDASGEVVFAAELQHRGQVIKKRLDDRRAVRHSRRNRKTRYRKPRFDNRRTPKGWLPPSLASRIANVLTWVNKFRRFCPITAISMELVKFDLQKMEHPEMAGIEYQQGILQGYEVREYLLEKWCRACTYCNVTGVPLQVEHINPRANGGTNRVSNLCLACDSCNKAKGKQDIRVFLAGKPDVLKKILAQAKAPLKEAAAMNGTRWALYEQLKATGLPIECGSGGLTKFNRTARELPKTHWLDAACVGKSTPVVLQAKGVISLLITANGHGSRQMCGTDKYGFPKRHRQRQKVSCGYQTGDIVRAVVTKGTKTGTYLGRVLIRATGSFDIATKQGRVQGISHRFCTPLHHNDGYSYQKGEAAFLPAMMNFKKLA